jgi:hypothetical protein
MNDRLADLQISKIIQEYTFLKADEDLKKELIGLDSPKFLEIINSELANIDPSLLKEPEKASSQKDPSKIKPLVKPEDIDNNTLVKLKKIYREIVKVTHPDKVDSPELNQVYIQTKLAYEKFDLFELYFIAKSLNISFKLTLDERKILDDLIKVKKESIDSLEKSFVWAWINAGDDLEKKKIVDLFIRANYLNK